MKSRQLWVVECIGSLVSTGMTTLKVIPLLLFATACSSTNMTTDETDNTQAAVYQKWLDCQEIYTRSPTAYWVSRSDSPESTTANQKLSHVSDLRRDLIANRCYAIMDWE